VPCIIAEVTEIDDDVVTGRLLNVPVVLNSIGRQQ